MSIETRSPVIEDFLQKIRVIHQRGVDRDALKEIVGLLEGLLELKALDGTVAWEVQKGEGADHDVFRVHEVKPS